MTDNKETQSLPLESRGDEAKEIKLSDLYRTVLEKVYGEEMRIWSMMNKVSEESGLGKSKEKFNSPIN